LCNDHDLLSGHKTSFDVCNVTPISDLTMEIHLPKPYDIV
jgi:hypothetical protein